MRQNLIFKGCMPHQKDGSAITFPFTINNSDGEIIDDSSTLSLTYNPTDFKKIDDLILVLNYSLNA